MRGQTVPLTKTKTMPKRTKKQLKERKEKAAEIAAMYNTVAGGGRMQENFGTTVNPYWRESEGPNLDEDLAHYRAIPAPKKP